MDFLRAKKPDSKKYQLPLEVKTQSYDWLGFSIYDYKIYADGTETKHTHIKFIDVNGVIIGKHMPTKLQNVYEKALTQIKTTATKTAVNLKQKVGETIASELKQKVEEVTEIASSTAKEIVDGPLVAGAKQGISNKLKESTSYASELLGKAKSSLKDKFSKKS